MQPGFAAPVEGNLGLGFLAGFLGSCVGLILVYAIAKGPQTKKGALIGFAVAVVLTAVSKIMMRHLSGRSTQDTSRPNRA